MKQTIKQLQARRKFLGGIVATLAAATLLPVEAMAAGKKKAASKKKAAGKKKAASKKKAAGKKKAATKKRATKKKASAS